MEPQRTHLADPFTSPLTMLRPHQLDFPIYPSMRTIRQGYFVKLKENPQVIWTTTMWYTLNNQYLKYGVYEDKKWEPHTQRKKRVRGWENCQDHYKLPSGCNKNRNTKTTLSPPFSKSIKQFCYQKREFQKYFILISV